VRRLFLAWLATSCLMVTGCAVHKRAQNPLPGVFRVAVVDFVDKTNGAEGLSTTKVTEIFASELQKIPSYEVVPVQEVREVLGPARIDTNQPQLVFEIARAVHAQAIIIGSINEYRAHYPPRVSLHCEMYAMVTGQPEAVTVSPEMEVEKNRQPLQDLLSPLALPMLPFDKKGHDKKNCHACGNCWGCKHGGKCHAGRGLGWKNVGSQNIDMTQTPGTPSTKTTTETPAGDGPSETPESAIQQMSAKSFTPEKSSNDSSASSAVKNANQLEEMEIVDEDAEITSPSPEPPLEQTPETTEDFLRGQIPAYRLGVKQAIDPIPIVEPWVIRHSRVFDSTNIGLTRKLRDYYFFNDDLRGGDWQGYLLRNEDFVRFACNQMIFEMLEAAGGDWKSLCGVRLPKPWLPWPPR
jgi:hypothetical protein